MLTLSAEIYEVLALAARYIFALLGVLIVLRAYLWLLSSHREKQERLQRLPDAGMIGEFVALSNCGDLPENASLPVPREGVLGFVRSCDLTVPCPGVHRQHLDFCWDDSSGLLVHPRSGCEAMVDGQTLNVRSAPFPMRHGSFLQVGSAVLRLRVFAGLDPNAGFDDDGQPETGMMAPLPEAAPCNPQEMMSDAVPSLFRAPSEPSAPFFQGSSNDPGAIPDSFQVPERAPDEIKPEPQPEGMSSVKDYSAYMPPKDSRKADRWKEDWSE